MIARFLMDHYGHFQVEVDGVKSPPALYEGVAVLEKDNKLYIGVSDYYKGELPTETVMEVTKLETTQGEPDACNIFRPNDPCTHKQS